MGPALGLPGSDGRIDGWRTDLGLHRVLKEGPRSWDWCQAATVVGRSGIISVSLWGVVSRTTVGLGVCLMWMLVWVVPGRYLAAIGVTGWGEIAMEMARGGEGSTGVVPVENVARRHLC